MKTLPDKALDLIKHHVTIFPDPQKPMVVLASSTETHIDEFYSRVMKIGFQWFGGFIPEKLNLETKVWFHDLHPNQYDVPNLPGVNNLGSNLHEVERWFAQPFHMPMFLIIRKRNTNKVLYKFEENELEIATVLSHFRAGGFDSMKIYSRPHCQPGTLYAICRYLHGRQGESIPKDEAIKELRPLAGRKHSLKISKFTKLLSWGSNSNFWKRKKMGH